MTSALDYTISPLFYDNLIMQSWPPMNDGDLAYISCLCSDSMQEPPEKTLRSFFDNDPTKLYALQEDERLAAKSLILAVAEEIEMDDPLCAAIGANAKMESSTAYHMLQAAVMRIHHEDRELVQNGVDITGLREMYAHPVEFNLSFSAPHQGKRKLSDEELMADMVRQAEVTLKESVEKEQVGQQREAAITTHAQRVAQYKLF